MRRCAGSRSAIGYSIIRNVTLKASWQRNLRDGGRVRRDSLWARPGRVLVLSVQAAGCRAWRGMVAVALLTASTTGSVCGRRSAQTLGAIRGRLDIRRMARPTERRPEVAEPGSAGSRDCHDLRRGVVYLETAPRGAFEEREAGRAVMDQRNETFVPHVLAVTVGTVVDFPNSDKTFHNVFSLSKAEALRPRPLRGRAVEVGAIRSAGRRARVLRHPLAHERVHPGLQPSVLRRHGPGRPLPSRQRSARHLHRRRLVRGRGAHVAGRDRARRAASSISSSWFQ